MKTNDKEFDANDIDRIQQNLDRINQMDDINTTAFPDAMEDLTKTVFRMSTKIRTPRLNSQVKPRLDQSLNPKSESSDFQTLSSVHPDNSFLFGPVVLSHTFFTFRPILF